MSHTVPLGELVDIQGGGTPSRSVEKYWGGSIPWASVQDFNSSSLSSTVETITDEGVANSATKVIPAGTVIIPTRMAVGKAAINTIDIAINQDLKAILPRKNVNTRFLLHFLLSRASFLQDQSEGVTVKGIRLDVLNSLEFPKLEISEQQRIAEILDKADVIRIKHQQALTLSNDLLKSAFLETFGNPATNAREWREVEIGDCLHGVVRGRSAKSRSRAARADEMGVLKISAVSTGEYLPRENRVVDNVPDAKGTVVPKIGDLLFGQASSKERFATPCIVMDAPENVFLPNNIWLLDENQQIAEAVYLKFVLAHPEYLEKLFMRTTSGNGPMLNISRERFLSHSIPLPDLGLQKEFSKFWEEVQRTVSKQRQALREVESMFSSLSQRAFRGEL